MNRLDALRGPAAPVNHNARSIAALAANPGCARRAVMDAAGVDMRKVAEHLGHPTPFGRSVFAIERARRFRRTVTDDGGAHLLRLLRERLGLSLPEVGRVDLADVGGDESPHVRYARTRNEIRRAAEDRDGTRTLLDRPLLRLTMAGYRVHLEPDVIACRAGGRFHVVTIKNFAIIDGQADSDRVSAAAREAAVHVHALRELCTELGLDPLRVSHEVLLVCPENFTDVPTGALLDVRRQLDVLDRQLARLTRIDRILDELPPGLSLDLRPVDGVPTRPPGELAAAVAAIAARYAPECLSSCELAYFCRAEARACGSVDVLGRAVRDDLGGVESVHTALGLADGTLTPAPEQAELAARLRYARQVYTEAVA